MSLEKKTEGEEGNFLEVLLQNKIQIEDLEYVIKNQEEYMQRRHSRYQKVFIGIVVAGVTSIGLGSYLDSELIQTFGIFATIIGGGSSAAVYSETKRLQRARRNFLEKCRNIYDKNNPQHV